MSKTPAHERYLDSFADEEAPAPEETATPETAFNIEPLILNQDVLPHFIEWLKMKKAEYEGAPHDTLPTIDALINDLNESYGYKENH